MAWKAQCRHHFSSPPLGPLHTSPLRLASTPRKTAVCILPLPPEPPDLPSAMSSCRSHGRTDVHCSRLIVNRMLRCNTPRLRCSKVRRISDLTFSERVHLDLSQLFKNCSRIFRPKPKPKPVETESQLRAHTGSLEGQRRARGGPEQRQEAIERDRNLREKCETCRICH